MIENTKTINKRKPLKPSELRKILHPEETVRFQNAEELEYREERQKFSEPEVEFLLERLPEKMLITNLKGFPFVYAKLRFVEILNLQRVLLVEVIMEKTHQRIKYQKISKIPIFG